MAKQKMGGANKQPVIKPLNPYATGDAIPTPETVPARKTSIIQPSKFAAPTTCTNTSTAAASSSSS